MNSWCATNDDCQAGYRCCFSDFCERDDRACVRPPLLSTTQILLIIGGAILFIGIYCCLAICVCVKARKKISGTSNLNVGDKVSNLLGKNKHLVPEGLFGDDKEEKKDANKSSEKNAESQINHGYYQNTSQNPPMMYHPHNYHQPQNPPSDPNNDLSQTQRIALGHDTQYYPQNTNYAGDGHYPSEHDPDSHLPITSVNP
ncbi:unnamed protein product [Moneuplotes crassus]|uniref:Uncharacterized protein n=1 Tax=Euplotes crassus TaxID=5936 RepID=A0AAD1XTB9_EUPCR|nr:unnamed protein product [Moneuplotes crassus]